MSKQYIAGFAVDDSEIAVFDVQKRIFLRCAVRGELTEERKELIVAAAAVLFCECMNVDLKSMIATSGVVTLGDLPPQEKPS